MTEIRKPGCGGKKRAEMESSYGCLVIRTGLIIALLLSGAQGCAEDETQQHAQAIAEKVEKRVERLQKAEGANDLVEDSVQVKKKGNGDTVIEQVGEASYYGRKFHGKKTASGEAFDQHDLTAAHPTLPLGTEAKVTNLETGKSIDVKINDRGPYAKGRDIDLSKQAAKKLGMTEDGAAPVKIEAQVPAPEHTTGTAENSAKK
ncbi:MAG: septal ring lytic transglycosylase RlpA family protein [Candidatus Binatia bacterium]